MKLSSFAPIVMNAPEGLWYTQDHEWIKIEGQVAIVGITDYAQSELGDIVYVDIPTLGQRVNQRELLGTIEAVKTVSDLFVPLTGKVVTVNTDLENSPEKINNEPYGEGWIAKIEITNPSEANDLLTAEAYLKQLGK